MTSFSTSTVGPWREARIAGEACHATDRTSSGYRVYSEDDVDRLRFVTLARSLGLPLDDIREILGLRDRGEAPCGYVRDVIARQVVAMDERLRELEEMAVELRRLQRLSRQLGDMASDAPCVCHILEGTGGGVGRGGQSEESGAVVTGTGQITGARSDSSVRRH